MQNSLPQYGREFYMEGRQAENNILPVLPGERAKIQGLRLTERAAAEDKKGSPNRRFGGVLVPLPPRAKELAPGGAKLPRTDEQNR